MFKVIVIILVSSAKYVYEKTNDNGIGQVATLRCNPGFAFPGNLES